MTLRRQLRFVLCAFDRMLEEGRLDRAWLGDVMRRDRHRIVSAEGADTLRQGDVLIDRWLEEGGWWRGDIRGDDLPDLVARALTEGDGRLSLPGGLALLALVGGVEHRTARWQFRLVELLYEQVDLELAALVDGGVAAAEGS